MAIETVDCASCGRANRIGAMFCIGCAGRLPGFVASGPSALEIMRALRLSSLARSKNAPRGGTAYGFVVPAENVAFWVRLLLLGLAMTVGFTAWCLYVTRNVPLSPVRDEVTAAPVAKPVVPQAPDAQSARTIAANVQTTEVPLQATALPARATQLPAESVEVPPSATPPRAMPPKTTAASAQPNGEASLKVVERFYRALSVGDGNAAAEVITPEKRGIGPYNPQGMSKFYRSLREPLVVQSIRRINSHVVEARYVYRAAKTLCEGTARVTTEFVPPTTVIRSIRANC